MKKLLFIAAIATLLGSCCNKNQCVIKGEIDNLEGYVYLTNFDTEKVDSVLVKDNKFTLKVAADTVAMGMISNADRSFRATLFIEPGKVSIEGEIDAEGSETRLSGTPTNLALQSYTDQVEATMEKYPEQGPDAEKEYTEITRASMEANMGNLLGATLLAQVLAYDMTGAETIAQIEKFSPEMQQKSLLTKLRVKAEAKMRVEVGQPYTDIVQNNAEGQPISLKSVIENPKNKYTLVDFWASWCRPCMAEVPVLIKTYKEFNKKGFEIYGVSFDGDAEKWQAAIKDNKMDWIQVSDLNRFDNQASKDYAVAGIPSNFLIDAQGVIVATNLRGEALYEKVAELLK